MKATYLLRNKPKFSSLKKILLIGAILIIGFSVFKIFGKNLISVAAPIWQRENFLTAKFKSAVEHFRAESALIAENKALKERLESLEVEKLALTREGQREEALLELLGRRGESGAIVAAVLTHPPQSPYDVIVVDAGAIQGVQVGARATLPTGPLVGHVLETTANQAKVELFSAPNIETNAVLERGNVPVVLVGNGGGNFKLKLQRDVVIELGDAILSSDITQRLVAVVADIKVGSTDSHKEVLAKSPTNIFTLRTLFITP